MENELILHDDKVWRRHNLGGLFLADIPVKADKGSPQCRYSGPKIPLDLLNQIKSFFHWTNATHHCESQVRMFLHSAEKRWAAWAFPQERGMGLHTKELQGETMDNQRAQFGVGWNPAGTIHHHCDIAAFQSGTDQRDELDGANGPQCGIHITFGNLNDERWSFHGRVVIQHNGQSVQYGCQLEDWFELPEEYERLLATLPRGLVGRDKLLEHIISMPDRDADFPAAWKENLIDPPKPQWSPGVGLHQPNGNHTSGFFNGAGFRQADETGFIKSMGKIKAEHGIVGGEMEDFFEIMRDIQSAMRTHNVDTIWEAEHILGGPIREDAGALEQHSWNECLEQ